MTLLQARDLTITIFGTEGADGVAPESAYAARGTIVDVTEKERLASNGAIPAGSVFVFFDPDGYETRWLLKEGCLVSDGVRTARISIFSPASNPRTGKLHHIEALGGLS